MNKRQLRDILKQDNARRAQRQQLEDAILFGDTSTQDDPNSDAFKIASAPRNAHVNPCLVRKIGVVSPPPKTSASRNSWDRGMSRTTTVGVAPGTAEQSTTEGATVAVTRNGITEVVPASAFNKKRETRVTHKRSTTAHTTETARITLRGMDWSQ